MTCGAEEPGDERVRVAELADPAIRREPDLLVDVVRIIADQPSQVTQRRRAEPVEQASECCLIPGLAPEHQEVEQQFVTSRAAMVRFHAFVSDMILSRARRDVRRVRSLW